ncbi:transporter substrate-binding domain-containing protein [Pseudochelatococcus sp. B33]
MTIFRVIKSAVFGMAVFGLAGPALADQLADIRAAGRIVTATDMHYAPFDMLVNGEYQGMTKDLFDEVSKEIGAEPFYQDIPWTAELPGLEVKKFDIVIAPVTITPERLERYTFTLPIADATVSLVKSARNEELQKPEDIKGKVVGVQQGTAQFRQLEAYGKELGGITVKEYGTTDEAYADLAAGRLDAVAGSLPNLTYLVKNRPETFALFEPASFGQPTYFAWVLRKEADSESFA